MSKTIVHVVVQTHWDREWYLPHQTTVARLIKVMQRVVASLEAGKIDSFLFDGQTAALEDLLAHCESPLAARVTGLLRAGKIIIGPWYVMADEFLVSGESLIRNLEIGRKDALPFGCGQGVGYLPDTFGHVAQMPQILKEFGIKSAVVWRGIDIAESEFDWCSPSGHVVGSLFLTQGYYQHPLNLANWEAALHQYLNQIAPRALSDQLVLTQGGDHLLPSDEMIDRLALFNKGSREFVLRENTLESCVNDTLAATDGRRRRVLGELRQNQQAFVLPDVLSTRRYLKQLHQSAEDRLLGEVEPLLAMLCPAQAYPERYLEQTWRLLLQQQAHDSICGCSVDAVHAEMVTRFEQLNQRLDALVSMAVEAAGLRSPLQHVLVDASRGVFADDSAFTLFNPLPTTFFGWQTIECFRRGAALERPTIIVLDDDALLNCELLSLRESEEFHSPLDDFPDRYRGVTYTFAVRVQISGMQSLRCALVDAELALAVTFQATDQRRIENDQLRIELDFEGRVNVTDLFSGVSVSTALALQHEMDAGDTYNFSPPAEQAIATQPSWTRVATRVGIHVSELELTTTMSVPAALSADRKGADLAKTQNTISLRLRLFHGEAQVHATLRLDNQSRDQRTRLLLPFVARSDAATKGVCWSDSAFNLDERPERYANYPDEVTRTETPVVVNPSLSVIVAGGWWVAHRAMQEFETIEAGGQRSLAITLVRSVGWMSRRDLVTRGVGAGPDFATPAAQCIGVSQFEFCFGLQGAHAPERALQHARQLRRPLLVLRGHAPPAQGIDIGNDIVQVSATRRVGDDVEIRIWNPTAVAQRIVLDGGEWRAVTADGRTASRDPRLVPPLSMHTARAALPWGAA
jgi:mannosylglycerate hydrolase